MNLISTGQKTFTQKVRILPSVFAAGGNKALVLVRFLVALLTFILALELLKKGGGGISSLLQSFSAHGILNLVGFGWLMAYVALSGSPVAATSLTLLGAGALSPLETFAMINGSRFGASFVVLFTGFMFYIRGHQRRGAVVSMGILSMITTPTIYLPAMLLGSVSLSAGWLSSARFGSPKLLSSFIDVLFDPITNAAKAHLHPLIIFVFGFLTLMAAFRLFDKALPVLDSEVVQRRWGRWLDRPFSMFLLGLLVTSVTLSVSISLTILVPLAARGFFKRRQVIPYIMGANISTFVDTLFASLLIRDPLAFTVVFTEMLSVTAVSLVVLILFFRRYQEWLLRFDRFVISSRWRFAGFVFALALAPLLLFLI